MRRKTRPEVDKGESILKIQKRNENVRIRSRRMKPTEHRHEFVKENKYTRKIKTENCAKKPV